MDDRILYFQLGQKQGRPSGVPRAATGTYAYESAPMLKDGAKAKKTAKKR